MVRKKRWHLAALIVTLGTAVLGACSSGNTAENLSEESIIDSIEIPVEETVEVESDPVLTESNRDEIVPELPAERTDAKDLSICLAEEPETLYPHGGSSMATRAVHHAVFENNFTQLTYNYQAQGIEKVPSLADGDAAIISVAVAAGDSAVAADGSVVTVQEGLSFTNSAGETIVFDGAPIMMDQIVVDFAMKARTWADGVPVTAADSVYSFNLAANPDTPTPKFVVNRTLSYEMTGDLSTRWAGIPGFRDPLYFTNFWLPLPQHVWGKFSALELLTAEESSRLPLGDGPFVIEEWIAGERINLTPNRFYYQEGLPYLDSLTFKFIPDTNRLIAQLVSGNCDIIVTNGLNTFQAPFLLEAEESGLLSAYFQPGTTWEHIAFGINPAPDYAATRPDWFEDERVRQAIAMCTDRQSMVNNILFGRSEVIHSYLPSMHPLYAEGLPEWPYDVDMANAFLDEAGYLDTDGNGIREDPTSGTPFAPTLGTTAGDEVRLKVLQMFKENQLDCGIDVQLYNLPAIEWYADGPEGPLFGTQFDLAEFAWGTDFLPPCQLFVSDQIPSADNGWEGQNITGFADEDYDDLCLTAVNNFPGTDEFVNAHQAAQTIFANQLPVLPLFSRLKVAAAGTNVLNFDVDPTERSELYNLYEIDLQP